ncbi:hypothetical protein DPMN_057649 [Dreissena polymorpha]|uniref:Sushi domain-containing protein n=1 Tax=Dreissena polymorpha TaxID=45954 RepID=A0A9D4C0J4_DREPO|nr:hypothetical protein DPMN_057649 [Dreissena polymorpha]
MGYPWIMLYSARERNHKKSRMMTSGLGISAVCLILCLGRIQANNYSDPYICYGDVCNSESPAQFCDVVYMHCRRCDDIRGDCFTRHQTFNCTEYCYEIRYKEEVEKLRVAGCELLPPPNNGHLNENRTHVPFNYTLTFTCNDGYVPLYIYPVRCGEFAIWIGPPPKCESSTTEALTALTITCGVCLVLSLLVNIFLLQSQIRRWRRNLKKKQKSSKETKRLLNSNKDGKMRNGTGPSAVWPVPAATAPQEQELDDVIFFDSDNTNLSQPPDTIQNGNGSRPAGCDQTPKPDAQIRSCNGLTGHAEEGVAHDDSSSRSSSDEDINNPVAIGGTTVGNIINNITNTNVHLHVISTPTPTPVGPLTAACQPQEPESPQTDKRPVEETDILGSQPGAPSQTVWAIPPENDDTTLKSTE